MANKHMKTSTALIIGEMLIKTTMRYCLTLVSTTTIKNLQTIYAWESMKKRERYYTISGNLNWYNHYGEQYAGSIKKTKNRATMIQQPHSRAYIWERQKL